MGRPRGRPRTSHRENTDMAHEMSFVGNRAQFFSVKETAWWDDGSATVDEAPNFIEALKLAGPVSPLSKRPYLIPVRNSADSTLNYVEAGDAFYVLREDTQKILGSVGSSYEIVPNEV